MKGISAIIATILMLLITVALAGTAYLFITGTLNGYTSVVLSLNGQLSNCQSNGGPLTVYVKNGGQNVAGTIQISITYPNGTAYTNVCSIAGIPAGGSNSTSCPRGLGGNSGSGSYLVTVTGGDSSANGPIFCNS